MANGVSVGQGDDYALLDRAMDVFGAETEAAWASKRGQRKHHSAFLDLGYRIYPIPPAAAEALLGFLSSGIERPFAAEDCDLGHVASRLTSETVATLNARHIYYGPAPEAAQAALEAFLDGIAESLEEELGHGFEVANVRGWRTRPSPDFGPTGWHADGFSAYVRKLMIYPQPMNAANGSFELIDRRGQRVLLETDHAACVLVDAAMLLHRGRPGSAGSLRPALEITLAPATATRTAYRYAGQNARMPRPPVPEIIEALTATRHVPSAIAGPVKRKTLRQRLGKAFGGLGERIGRLGAGPPGASSGRAEPAVGTPNLRAFVNIGGGPGFLHPGWMNLETIASDANPVPFRFSPDCRFPIPTGTIRTVYSSHCLEHLDDDTLARVLEEARRVMARDAALVVKIPCYEDVLKAWREKDSAFFASQWGLNGIVSTWSRRGLADSIDTRASMVLCGFWNAEWGDHFDPQRPAERPGSYHGPAPVPEGELKTLLSSGDPRRIVQTLAARVRETEADFTFNHQNAWSRAQFCDLLGAAGFNVISTDAEAICAKHHAIPGIREMYAMSAYYEAVIA